MEKLWAGRSSAATSQMADDFNSSIHIDSRMYREDIRGSMAHAAMLGARGIISAGDAEAILAGLEGILADIDSGRLSIDMEAEDIHMFIEAELTRRIGDPGRRLHTARSRNDQVAVDCRLYLRQACRQLEGLVKELIAALTDRAGDHKAAIMPGYTHLQRAQPVTLGHHLMAYAMMLLRDLGRLKDARGRMNVSPLGSCALAGTTYDTDRESVAAELGFDGVCLNSLDGVSDRDFCVELTAAIALLMAHLSRLAEELVLWSSWEFRFIELSDAYTTGSSIMPQKKNPDMAELVRGKTGRVYGDLITLLTMLKGLPLAYNKDMQEDKEAVFDACDTARRCVEISTAMIRTMSVRADRMLAAAAEGFINATDLADYLVKKGMPFRQAYKLTGSIVARCMEQGWVLETMPLEEYRRLSELFDPDLYGAISLAACVDRRRSQGGTCVASVEGQIAWVQEQLQTL